MSKILGGLKIDFFGGVLVGDKWLDRFLITSRPWKLNNFPGKGQNIDGYLGLEKVADSTISNVEELEPD